MSVSELISSGGIGIIALLSLIQISPIKWNPWSMIAKAIGKSLNADVVAKIDENEAKNDRYRILRFDDEIRHGTRHTEEHFNQILEDIKEYENYCKEHPNFPNRKAEGAIEKINETYEHCKDAHSFL